MIRVLVRLVVIVIMCAVLVAVHVPTEPAKPPHAERPVAVVPQDYPSIEVALENVRDAFYAEQKAVEDERVEAERLAEEERTRRVGPAVPRQTAGAHSDAWWHAIAVCEQGGRNDPFFGYFSIMDGSVGGLPWDVQVNRANGIIARAGDSAWAASCVAAGYAAAPGG